MVDEFDVAEGDQPQRPTQSRKAGALKAGRTLPMPGNEENTFGIHHDKFMKATASAESQKWYLRGVALVLAVAVILAAGFLEWLILFKLSDKFKDNDALLFLAISPIVAITAITIFILIGVFQGFRDKDMQRLPGSTAIRSFSGE